MGRKAGLSAQGLNLSNTPDDGGSLDFPAGTSALGGGSSMPAFGLGGVAGSWDFLSAFFSSPSSSASYRSRPPPLAAGRSLEGRFAEPRKGAGVLRLLLSGDF